MSNVVSTPWRMHSVFRGETATLPNDVQKDLQMHGTGDFVVEQDQLIDRSEVRFNSR